MPITNHLSMAKCPNCGLDGPANFRVERRATLKYVDAKHTNLLNVLYTEVVYACIRCGATVQVANSNV